MAIDIKKNLSENKGLWVFVGAAVVVAVLLAVFISPFASSSPDGLEKVAEDKEFLKKAEENKPAWTHSPLPDYQVTAVKNEKVSTGISGFLGVLITLAVALALGVVVYRVGRWRSKGATEPPSEPTMGSPDS